jgi:hypothetical protein
MIALWDARCLEILRRNEGRCHDHEMAALIEAATGMHFSAKTVQRYRIAAGLEACTRNDWTAPLARCKACLKSVLA